MRILLVTDWPRAAGGVEAYVGTLRGALRRAGHEVRLLTSTAGTAADGTADYRAYGTTRRAAQTVLQVANPFAVGRARMALRDFRPQVAFVTMVEHHLSPAVLTALRAVPTVLSVPDYKLVCPLDTKLLPDGSPCAHRAGAACRRGGCLGLAHWLRDQPRYALLRGEVARVERVLTVSRWMRDALARDGIAADVLELPVPRPGPGSRRIPAPDPRILFVGRLSPEKGVATLLRAFARAGARTPSAHLRIVGDGPERADLAALAADLGLARRVTFTGHRPPVEVEREIASAWALAAPSLWAEPLGLVALEAVVRGVPVVASARGGLAESVRPGLSGLLVENGDEVGLAAALGDVIEGRAFPDHALAPEVVREALERTAPERHAAALARILAEAAVSRARAGRPAG